MSGGMAEVLAEGRRLHRSHAPAFLGVVIVHAVAGWALLSMNVVREAVIDVIPAMLVTMIESRPTAEPYVPPPPADPQPQLTPLPILIPLPVATEATSAPAAMSPPRQVEVVAVSDVEAPVRAHAPAPPPRSIPASAVEYVVMPKPVYPLYSRRAREIGIVLLRVLINEKGMPAQIEVEKSSGYSRLDDAALVAMQGARFKPYTENGVALAVWAPAPIVFEL